MVERWRGLSAGIATVVLLAAGSALSGTEADSGARSAILGGDASAPGWQLVVRDVNQEVLLRAPLPESTFALRYRNSVYRSLAEERFTITGDGRISLIELAADEAAVLGEYYGVAARPDRGAADDARRWRAPPRYPVVLDRLGVAASEHGRRTLLVDGSPPVSLWSLVPDENPNVTLTAERGP